MVLSHAGLRVWRRHGTRRVRGRHCRRRNGCGQCQISSRHARLLVLPADGGSFAGEHFGLSTVGGDTINAVKQAAEFGLTQNNRKIVVFLMFLPEVHAIGLAAAHGLYITDGFYWDKSKDWRLVTALL